LDVGSVDFFAVTFEGIRFAGGNDGIQGRLPHLRDQRGQDRGGEFCVTIGKGMVAGGREAPELPRPAPAGCVFAHRFNQPVLRHLRQLLTGCFRGNAELRAERRRKLRSFGLDQQQDPVGGRLSHSFFQVNACFNSMAVYFFQIITCKNNTCRRKHTRHSI
jgi:hypothetical protein